MANVQLENGYTRIANELLEQIIFRDFSKNQLNIILFIIRLSYGCNKKNAFISTKSKFQLAGVHKNHIKNSLEYLQANKVIIIDNNIYSLNKNIDEWLVPYKQGVNMQDFKKLLVENFESSTKSVLNHPQKVDAIHHKKCIESSTKSGLREAENADSQGDVVPPKDNKDNKDNKEIKKDTYIKDDFLNFLSEKNVKLDFGLVDIKKTEYDVLFSRVLNAGVVKNEQEAEALLIEIIKEYDTWRAKGKGSENQFADLITFTKNRIRDIKNDSSKIKPLKLKQEREPDPYDLFFASLKRGG